MKDKELKKNEEEKKKLEKEIKEEIEKEKKLSKEYLETLQRVQAEFENYMKRVEKDKEEFVKYAKHDLILKLLHIIDDFGRALNSKEAKEEFVKGVEMIFKQLNKTLHEEGVREISALGEKFDVYRHDIVGKVEGNKDDIIVEEVRRGYMLKDKVLRPSLVKVSKVKEVRENE